MMTFSTRVAQRSLGVMFYCRISGLPYIFASQAIPSSWDAGGGTTTISSETYTWSATLMTDDDFGTVEQRAEPKSGVGITGSMKLRFAVRGTANTPTSDVWLDLTNASLVRSDRAQANLWLDLLASDTTATTTDLPNTVWTASTPTIYLGTETMTGTRNTGGSFTSLSRGKYGSKAIFHPGVLSEQQDTPGLGPLISTGPLTLSGRVLELWVGTGYFSGGVFVPYGTSAMGNEDRKIYAGIINDAELSSDADFVEVDTQSIDQWLAKEVATRLPTAVAGNRHGWHMIQVDDSDNEVSFRWTSYRAGGSNAENELVEHLTLQRDNEAGGSENVPNGLYSFGAIGEFISWTIEKAASTATFFGSYGTPQWRGRVYNAGDDVEPRYAFEISLPSTSTKYTQHTTFEIVVRGTTHPQAAFNRSIWCELGFTQSQLAEVTYDSNRTYFTVTADRKAHVFRWPANRQNRVLYYDKKEGPAFDTSPGWTDDDANAVGAYAVINGIEAIKFTADSGEALQTAGRNQLDTECEGETYVEFDADEDKRPTVWQAVALPGVSLARALLYCMIGHDGTGDVEASQAWDQGWWGAGAAIHPDYIDIASFTLINARRADQQFRRYAFCKPTELRKAFADDLVLSQLFLGTSSGKIALFEVIPPLEINSASAHTVSHDEINSRGGWGWDASNSKLINKIELRGVYDLAKDKYYREVTQFNQTSIATYGEQRALKLDLRGIPNRLATIFPAPKRGLPFYSVGPIAARQIFGAYAWPYVVLELDIADLGAWNWSVGDAVSITHDALPATTTVDRGWTSVLGRIYAIKYFFKKPGVRARITVVTRRHDGRRFSAWAPSALLTTKNNASEFVAAANTFTYSGDGADVDSFYSGIFAQVMDLATGTIYFSEVESVSGNTITFVDSIAGGAPALLMYDTYDAQFLEANQQSHIYLAHEGPPGALSPFSGSDDPAFRYL